MWKEGYLQTLAARGASTDSQGDPSTASLCFCFCSSRGVQRETNPAVLPANATLEEKRGQTWDALGWMMSLGRAGDLGGNSCLMRVQQGGDRKGSVWAHKKLQRDTECCEHTSEIGGTQEL
mmetsp:Transcript_10796/g.20902  ORF Transcript_10796/g.20902 Transcript_10796/m.20902 type:complete len:121 (-) Transcript_10796:242-604(-)